MKKLYLIILTALFLASCGAPDEAADLRGNWIEKEYDEGDTYMTATITDATIEVNWTKDGGETTSIYWIGTYTAPTEAGDYTWESMKDAERTASALLASQDDTKTFTYSNGEITYSQSALGTTTTIHLVPAE